MIKRLAATGAKAKAPESALFGRLAGTWDEL